MTDKRLISFQSSNLGETNKLERRVKIKVFKERRSMDPLVKEESDWGSRIRKQTNLLFSDGLGDIFVRAKK